MLTETILNSTNSNAGYQLSKAVSMGELVRPDRCENCGKIGKVQGHHEDYNLPLEVVWLCQDCHIEIHKIKGTWNNSRRERTYIKTVAVNLDLKQAEEIKKLASRDSLSVSAWMRQAALEKLRRDKRKDGK